MWLKECNCLLICALITVTLSYVNVCNGWKLRDLTQKNDENKLLPKRPIFRDMPMKKIVRIEKVKGDSNEASKSKDDNGVEGNDGEDDEEDFTFEKAHTTHYDLPLKTVITLTNPDVEQEQEEQQEAVEETNKISSLFSQISNINLFGDTADHEVTKENNEKEHELSGYFGWLTKTTNESIDANNPTEDVTKSVDVMKWFSYLKSFNVFSDLFNQLDDNSNADNDGKHRKKLNEYTDREPLTAKTFEKLLLTIPSFIPNYTKINDVDCKRMGQIFQRQVRGQKLWALQMMDASAKIPSGLLRGNANQLGDFDLCTGIRTKVKITDDKSVKIKGKYCLANIDVFAEDDALKMSIHLAQGRNFLRSRLEDPSHFLPRFSTLKWAICLPSGCNNDNVLQIVSEFFKPFNSTGIKIFPEIDENSCYVKSRKSWLNIMKENWQVSATIAYFMFFVVATIVSSLNDYWKILRLDILFAPDKKKANSTETINDLSDSCAESFELHKNQNESESTNKGILTQILMAFSIKNTGSALFNFDDENGNSTFRCVDGLKGLSTVPLFLTFKLLTFGHLPFTNKAHLTKILYSSLSIFLRASFLFMDVFLLASGFFAGYKFSNDLSTHNRIPWIRRIIGRFVRLVPSLTMAILFSAWILPYIGNGPQWGTLIQQNANLCQQNYWKNVFLIQNFFPVHEQCSPHLQQLSIDFQLFLVAPIIVYMIGNKSIIGVGIFGVVSAFSAAMRYSSSLSERLSFVIFQGMKLSQFYRTINISFGSTLQRSTSYFIGLGLGVILFHSKRDVKLPKAIFVTGWLSCIWSLFWCFWAPSNLSSKDYIYEPTDSAVYAAWAPLIWSLSLSWIIFVIYSENGEILRRLLTARPLIFLSRISYQMFFVQFIILFSTAASVRNSETFGWWSFINYSEIFSIIGISIVSTILFDLPFQTISRIITSHIDIVELNDSSTDEAIKEDQEDSNDKEKNEENEIDEIWANNESRSKVSFEEKNDDDIEDEVYSKRSFTPIWKKSDEEEPVWGDDDEEVNDKSVLPSNPKSEPEGDENASDDENVSGDDGSNSEEE